MSLPLLVGDYASQLWQNPPSGINQPLAYGPGGVVLGSEETNSVSWVENGSYVKFSQAGDYDGAHLVRIRGSLRANTDQEDGLWQVLLQSGGYTTTSEDWSAYYSRGWEQRFDDLAINVTSQVGAQTLQFGLSYTGTTGYQTLPSACISAVQLITSTDEVALINRFPSPGATDVPHNLPTWRLDIADFTANGIDVARTVIHVNGYKVFDGVDQGAYTSSSSLVGPASDSLRIELDVNPALPAYTFLSEGASRVSVATYTVAGSVLFEEDYSFEMADILAPTIKEVIALEGREVRVIWDDTMRADGTIFAANRIDNYAISFVTIPAFTPEIIQVEQESASTYLLTLDQELTFGATYTLLASNYIEDHSGNSADEQGRERSFEVGTPDSMTGRNFRLENVIPAYNIDKYPIELPNFLNSLQDSVDLFAVQIDRWSDILEIDNAPTAFIDGMLSDLGFPFFWDDASYNQRRRWVREIIRLYGLKGTAVGIVAAIRVLLNIDATLTFPDSIEDIWILGEGILGEAVLGSDNGDPLLYSFIVTVEVYLTDELRERITQVINYFKCPHEHLLELTSTVLDPPITTSYWILGDESEGILGSTTVLYG